MTFRLLSMPSAVCFNFFSKIYPFTQLDKGFLAMNRIEKTHSPALYREIVCV